MMHLVHFLHTQLTLSYALHFSRHPSRLAPASIDVETKPTASIYIVESPRASSRLHIFGTDASICFMFQACKCTQEEDEKHKSVDVRLQNSHEESHFIDTGV